MIQLFERDACAFGSFGPGDAAPRLTAWRSLVNRDIAPSPFFRDPSPGKGSNGMIRSNRWTTILVRDDPEVRLNPRSGSQREGASDVPLA